MKKLFFITIILLLQSFPSFGNSNVMGLICESLKTKPTFVPIIGFWLDGKNRVKFFHSVDIGDYHYFEGRYSLKDFSISMSFPKELSQQGFGVYSGNFVINRETGQLKKMGKPELTKWYNKENWFCNRVSSNEKNFISNIEIRTKERKKIEEIEKKEKQKEYKDRLNKRKF